MAHGGCGAQPAGIGRAAPDWPVSRTVYRLNLRSGIRRRHADCTAYGLALTSAARAAQGLDANSQEPSIRPDIGFISVSDVEVTRDLAHARVYVTVFEEGQAPATLKALKRAAGFLRSRLGQEMRIRTVPELHFLHDASVETGQKMDRLIEQAVASDAAPADSADTDTESGPGERDADT